MRNLIAAVERVDPLVVRGRVAAVSEAFETMKKYENVAKDARARTARETARRDDAVLDEIGLRRAAGRR